MTALVIANVRPRNREKMQNYAEAAARTMAPYGGEVLHRGAFNAALAGTAEPHGLGVIRFPDAAAARAWFASDDYQAVVPLREEAADMTIVLYDVAG